MTKKSGAESFEAKLEKLESIVARLEQGDLALEQSLAEFEQGVKLLQDCQQSLVQAEQKVQLLMEKQGKIVTEPLVQDADEE